MSSVRSGKLRAPPDSCGNRFYWFLLFLLLYDIYMRYKYILSGMRRQRIPNDNSCLFTAVDYLTSNCEFGIDAAANLRLKCVDVIKADPEKYDVVRLEKEPEDYCNWLMQETSWGGEIEILILCDLCQVEISVVSIETTNTLTYSPTTSECKGRIYVLYNGQHYDAMVSLDGESLFPLTDPIACGAHESHAKACAAELKAEFEKSLRRRVRQRIKCLGCDAIVADGKAFEEHCNVIEHAEDFAYDCENVEVEETVLNADDD